MGQGERIPGRGGNFGILKQTVLELEVKGSFSQHVNSVLGLPRRGQLSNLPSSSVRTPRAVCSMPQWLHLKKDLFRNHFGINLVLLWALEIEN